jgi:hypothetical protein
MKVQSQQFTKWLLYLTWLWRIADNDTGQCSNRAHWFSLLEMVAVGNLYVTDGVGIPAAAVSKVSF